MKLSSRDMAPARRSALPRGDGRAQLLVRLLQTLRELAHDAHERFSRHLLVFQFAQCMLARSKGEHIIEELSRYGTI